MWGLQDQAEGCCCTNPNFSRVEISGTEKQRLWASEEVRKKWLVWLKMSHQREAMGEVGWVELYRH